MFAKYNTATQLDGIPLITRDAMDFKANPTLAAGDVKISKDGGASQNIGTLPTVAPAGGTKVEVVLSASEVQCKICTITFIDQTASKEWEDQRVILYTYGNASAFIAGDLSDMAKQTTQVTAAAKTSVWDGVVASGADNRTFKVTTFPVGADWTKAAVKITSIAGGKAEVRRIYSMSSLTGLVTIEPDLGFNVAANDTINVYNPMLLKTDFLMDGNALHSTADGKAYAKVLSAGDMGDNTINSAALATASITKIRLGVAGAQMDLVNAPNATALAAVKTALTLPTGVPKGVALPNFTFPMWDASNPEKVKSGLVVTGTIRKDGGAFAALTNAISEIAATGMYTVNITAAEMTADLIELKFVAVGGSDQPVLIKTNA